ncbi:MAG: 2,3,4,5-tetrahydropyridine-2,6-dicarboxylate N-succinyltransferase [Alphaproteobacteria bacterium]|nr:2,3,4,5-tetrahydropyridine-2,6-dicarboxylate N-succinyltransferase [Rickettsiales bacterium]
MTNDTNIKIAEISKTIEDSWNLLLQNKLDTTKPEIKKTIDFVINKLNDGSIRVAEKINDKWQTNQWVKKAILLSFKTNNSQLVKIPTSKGSITWYDIVDLKTNNWSEEQFINKQIRAVPGSFIRNGSYIGKSCVIMPSFVNIGAYIGNETMIDIWSTIGSCAQIGKRCHVSSNASIGGVLEPVNQNPVIIEDDCFIGAGSQIVEGVIVEKGSVISNGVSISASTRIVDRETGNVSFGIIPAGSVVVSGSVPSQKYPNVNMSAAIIVKKVDLQSRNKVALNDLLRSLN